MKGVFAPRPAATFRPIRSAAALYPVEFSLLIRILPGRNQSRSAATPLYSLYAAVKQRSRSFRPCGRAERLSLPPRGAGTRGTGPPRHDAPDSGARFRIVGALSRAARKRERQSLDPIAAPGRRRAQPAASQAARRRAGRTGRIGADRRAVAPPAAGPARARASAARRAFRRPRPPGGATAH